MLISIFVCCVFVALIPSFFFSLEVFLGAFRRSFDYPITGENPSCTIIIPAHNEEQVLAATLSQLMLSVSSHDQIVVVADNCSDATAEVAKKFNCVVLERTDVLNRGKGFALAHGLAFINKEYPPDIVVFVDADCDVEEGAINRLKKESFSLMAPVQATYLLVPPAVNTAKTRVSAFAIYIKNYVRPMGLSLLGGSVPITGSGFAVPYRFLCDVELATGEIVEDMKLGMDLLLAGHRTYFSPNVKITSLLPEMGDVANVQRERWEHGHLSMVVKYAPQLFMRGLTTLNKTVLLTALDMCILPLTLLVALSVCVLGLCTLAALVGLGWFSVLCVFLSLLGIISSLWLANNNVENAYLDKTDIFGLIKFAVSKVAVYRSVLKGKKSTWVKTRRDN